MIIKKLMREIEKIFPLSLRTSRLIPVLQSENEWPNWLCLPLYYWSYWADQEISKNKDKNDWWKKSYEDKEFLNDLVHTLAFIGTWRLSKGVYKFDKDIYKELINTKTEGILPSNVLKRIPEYCLYIETPGLELNKEKIMGCWIMLNWRGDELKEPHKLDIVLPEILSGVNPDYTELLILPNEKNNYYPGNYFMLPLTDKPLCETLTDYLTMISETHRINMPDSYDPNVYFNPERVQSELNFLNKVIPLILYLCSEEPEIELGRKPGFYPKYARAVQTKKEKMFFPIQQPKIWKIGRKLGEKIRDAREMKLRGQRDGVIPHIRRAHWHGYWKGPRKGEREFIYKWLAPIFVGEGEEYLKDDN